MRSILILVLLSFTTAAVASADEAARQPAPTHLRSLSGDTFLADAIARSAIVAALVDELEQTDVIVYVSQSLAAGFPHAYVAFLGCGPGVRYLLIRIDPWLAPPPVRIAWLAHELQHALEVARAPEVRDEQGLGGLYRRIGWEVSNGRFESEAALAVGRRVAEQLAQSPRPAATGARASAAFPGRR